MKKLYIFSTRLFSGVGDVISRTYKWEYFQKQIMVSLAPENDPQVRVMVSPALKNDF
jgi:hypothetical protein